MFYIILVLVLAFLGTWNPGPFLASLDHLGVVSKSVLSLLVIGAVPAAIIVAGGMFDAVVSSRRQSK